MPGRTVVGSLLLAALSLAPAGSAVGVSSPKPSESGVQSDFNGDGFADLAVGAPREALGSIDAAGAVNVLYGSAGGLQVTSPEDQFWHQDIARVQDAAEEQDAFGLSLR